MKKGNSVIGGWIAVFVAAFCMIAISTEQYYYTFIADYSWIFGFGFFLAALTAAVYLRQPAVSAVAVLLFIGVNFYFEKQSLFLLAPVAVLVWYIRQVLLPAFKTTPEDKKEITRRALMTLVPAAASFIWMIVAVAVAAKLKPLETRGGYYIAAWLLCWVYYLYIILLKSKLPFIENKRLSLEAKLKAVIKKAKKHL